MDYSPPSMAMAQNIEYIVREEKGLRRGQDG